MLKVNAEELFDVENKNLVRPDKVWRPRQGGRTRACKRCSIMISDCYKFKALAIERSFDSEGRPYPIIDDDLEDLLSRSDFATPRGWSK